MGLRVGGAWRGNMAYKLVNLTESWQSDIDKTMTFII